MTLEQRVRAIERWSGRGGQRDVPVVWDGRNQHPWRERLEEARRRGWRARVIRLGIRACADTPEKAEDLIAEPGRRHGGVPITVHRASSCGQEILATWDPGLPAWIREGGGNDDA